jgi:hypothetical protein
MEGESTKPLELAERMSANGGVMLPQAAVSKTFKRTGTAVELSRNLIERSLANLQPETLSIQSGCTLQLFLKPV